MPRSRSRARLASLRRARAELSTAAVLLDLSRSLAEVGTSVEAAQRIAQAVPAVTGSDQASVLLPDAAGRFTVRGVAGHPDPAAAIVERGGLTPELLGAPLGPLPTATLTRIHEATPAAREVLAGLGLEAVVLLPIEVRGSLTALLTADWIDAQQVPADDVLGPRLAALADQAAMALANADLLDRVRHQALHDSLTGLPNQTLFDDRAAHAVARARRHGGRLALGVVDLDRFKAVNDSLGHRAGDELLVQVAARLRGALREPDTLARMGGDEFIFLLAELEPHGEALVAERLLTAFEAPFPVDGHQLRMSPSIGLAVFPADGETPERLLRSADAAMYRAKRNGRNTWAAYAGAEERAAYDRLTLEADLQRAIERRQLRLGFQPLARVTDRRRVAVEALVRWEHPSFGVLGPREFVPLAEEAGIITEIDTWVLRQACRALGRADAGDTSLERVTVNLSARTVARASLVGVVEEALSGAGLAPERLVIEVTEALTATASSSVLDTLAKLRKLGVAVALDDFGRGHAPLADLGELPIDMIKLDQSFLRGVSSAAEYAPVVSGVVAMAHGLGLDVAAVGVETDEQLAFVERIGCDLAQGFLLGRAAPAPA